jgi:hypothetical protein
MLKMNSPYNNRVFNAHQSKLPLSETISVVVLNNEIDSAWSMLKKIISFKCSSLKPEVRDRIIQFISDSYCNDEFEIFSDLVNGLTAGRLNLFPKNFYGKGGVIHPQYTALIPSVETRCEVFDEFLNEYSQESLDAETIFSSRIKIDVVKRADFFKKTE